LNHFRRKIFFDELNLANDLWPADNCEEFWFEWKSISALHWTVQSGRLRAREAWSNSSNKNFEWKLVWDFGEILVSYLIALSSSIWKLQFFVNHCSMYLFARKALTVGVCDRSCDTSWEKSFVARSFLTSADISWFAERFGTENSNDSGPIEDPMEGAADPSDPNSASLKPFLFIFKKLQPTQLNYSLLVKVI